MGVCVCHTPYDNDRAYVEGVRCVVDVLPARRRLTWRSQDSLKYRRPREKASDSAAEWRPRCQPYHRPLWRTHPAEYSSSSPDLSVVNQIIAHFLKKNLLSIQGRTQNFWLEGANLTPIFWRCFSHPVINKPHYVVNHQCNIQWNVFCR